MKFIFCLLLVFTFINCDLQKTLLVVDINEISKLSRSDIEAKYGKPIEIGHDKSIKYDQISYLINDNEVYIEYEKNKPIWILILNPKKAKFDPNPLIYFNFDALSPNFSSYAVKRWNTVPGFKEISVVSDQKGGLTQIVFNISRKFKNEMQ